MSNLGERTTAYVSILLLSDLPPAQTSLAQTIPNVPVNHCAIICALFDREANC